MSHSFVLEQHDEFFCQGTSETETLWVLSSDSGDRWSIPRNSGASSLSKVSMLAILLNWVEMLRLGFCVRSSSYSAEAHKTPFG